jgi:hypothetical protein
MTTTDEAQYRWLRERLDGVANKAAGQFRAAVIVQVAMLRLLIAHKITTTEAAIQEIEQVMAEFTKVFQWEDVATSTRWAIDCLRGETPPRGSIIGQQIQLRQREKAGHGALGQTQMSEGLHGR